VAKDPLEVRPAADIEFLADQRGDRSVVRMTDRESGLSARTIARRLSSVSGFYAYLIARGDTAVAVNPVPRGLSTRRAGGTRASRTAPLVRVPRTLPTILSPLEVDALLAALRTARDRAMVTAMLLACVAARSWACGWQTSMSLTAGCSLSKARADTTGWCRWRTGSSTPS
jgi:integrase/recombinase XerD